MVAWHDWLKHHANEDKLTNFALHFAGLHISIPALQMPRSDKRAYLNQYKSITVAGKKKWF
jgi:hypothetical protein